MLNKDFKYLQQYESNLNTAVKSSYSRNLSRTVYEEMNEIYQRETKKSNSVNYSCSVCCLRLLKDIGKIYFMEKEQRELKKKEVEDVDKG